MGVCWDRFFTFEILAKNIHDIYVLIPHCLYLLVCIICNAYLSNRYPSQLHTWLLHCKSPENVQYRFSARSS